jgi:hypothetical protein
MLHNYKLAIATLLDDGMLSYKYRVLDKYRNPVCKISAECFLLLMPILRKQKMFYLINKSVVRQQHGNSIVKKLYDENIRKKSKFKRRYCNNHMVATIKPIGYLKEPKSI